MLPLPGGEHLAAVCTWLRYALMGQMQAIVRDHIDYFQILDPVVSHIAVAMVNVFIWPQFAAKVLLHDPAVFADGLAVTFNDFVRCSRTQRSAFLSIQLSAELMRFRVL